MHIKFLQPESFSFKYATASAVVPEPAKKSRTNESFFVPIFTRSVIRGTGFGPSNNFAPKRFLSSVVAVLVLYSGLYQIDFGFLVGSSPRAGRCFL